MKVNRKANFELLRIVAMLFIISHHCTLSLGLYDIRNSALIDQNFQHYFAVSSLNSFFIIGVNLFFILSGYFQIKTSWKKNLAIVLNLYFYSTCIRILGLCLGEMSFNTEFVKEVLLPFSVYWFITVYLILSIIAPYLNIIIDNMSEYQYKCFYYGVLIICGLIGWIKEIKLLGIGEGYSLVSAMYLYIIGGGIKRFDCCDQKRCFFYVKYLMCVMINVLLSYLTVCTLKNGEFTWKIYSYNSMINILATVYLLRLFARISISGAWEKIILSVSPYILAVYYLHSSSWMAKFRNMPVSFLTHSMNILEIFLYIILYSILIFCMCIFVDMLKVYLIDRNLIGQLDVDKFKNIFVLKL